MKVTAGAHPDLPYPFINGPEEPVLVLRGRAEPLRPASERYEHGVQHLAALMNHWLGRSDLSHDQLCCMANWGLNEHSTLIASTISRIRNGQQARGAGIKHLDAMAAANYAIWLWQRHGQSEAWADLGPHSSWGVDEESLNRAIWLPSASNPMQPLTFPELAMVLAGQLELDYLATTSLSPGSARKASDQLTVLLDRLISQRGWGPREGIQQLLLAYPIDDKARQRRLQRLIVGDIQLNRDELESELHALAEMIRVVRQLKPGSYGPAELQVELLSDLL